ncbi:MAG: hypothetical protein ABL908_05990 [Hyphomicrobium sp.]
MTTQLYTVTVTDLASYRLTVAADTPSEAKGIATTVLYEEALSLPMGMYVVKRETDATAEVASEQPVRKFAVHGVYQLGFSLPVPAANAGEAEQHARRIYEQHAGPFEFENDGGSLTRLVAQEVVL